MSKKFVHVEKPTEVPDNERWGSAHMNGCNAICLTIHVGIEFADVVGVAQTGRIYVYRTSAALESVGLDVDAMGYPLLHAHGVGGANEPINIADILTERATAGERVQVGPIDGAPAEGRALCEFRRGKTQTCYRWECMRIGNNLHKMRTGEKPIDCCAEDVDTCQRHWPLPPLEAPVPESEATT